MLSRSCNANRILEFNPFIANLAKGSAWNGKNLKLFSFFKRPLPQHHPKVSPEIRLVNNPTRSTQHICEWPHYTSKSYKWIRFWFKASEKVMADNIMTL